jgi:hypothetical protein
MKTKLFSRVSEGEQRRRDKEVTKKRRKGELPPPPHVMPHQRMLRRTMAKWLAKQKRA